jgi:hypothetical protein
MARSPAENGNGEPDGSEPPAETREEQVRGILRRIYDDVLSEPVPDSFADLLKKLD